MKTDGENIVIRRAKALASILENMSVTIHDGELLAGTTTGKRRGSFLIPEIQWEWYLNEMDNMSTRSWDRCQPIGNFERDQMLEYLPYWRGKCTWDKVNNVWNNTVLKLNGEIFMTHTSSMSGQHFGHIAVDYPRMLSRGLRDIINEANEYLAQLPVSPEQLRRHTALKAEVIAMEAVITYAKRYSKLASDLARDDKDPERSAELLEISRICEKVPEHPAETFYEALQSSLLLYFALRIEAYAPGVSLGRPDQYLYPYFARDIESGILAEKQCVELLEMLLIKMNDLACLMSTETVEFLSGFPTLASITIGGVKPDGTDSVNPLTYLLMEAERNIRLTAEEIVVRISRENSDEFVIAACELAVEMKGKIKFISDETTIAMLMHDGKCLKDARDYVILGCASPSSAGRSLDITAGGINFAYILELALNNGKSRLSGEQIGLCTGDPREFASFDELWNALEKQIEYVLLVAVSSRNTDRLVYAENVPAPLHSAMLPTCFDSGLDIVNVGAKMYSTESHGAVGVPNVGDSLAAIKKLIFEEKKYTMAELIDALEKNFEGCVALHGALLAALKFGNDIDYVDNLVNDVLQFAASVLEKCEGISGTKHTLAAMAGTGNFVMGSKVGALPDGRLAGKPLSEGGISPSQGKNTSGATASMRSVAKLKHTAISGGSVFNMRFNPSAVDNENKMRKFAMMLRTYCETGGFHVQFNFLSAETLRAAQADPQLYRDLLVRVATYSAYFVELSKQVQDDIIVKTEFKEA
jgi:formate C-acetyltransferase